LDHSRFLLPTQVWLLLLPTWLLASTTWSSHPLSIPLWQPRSHPKPGPWSMKVCPFTRYVYIIFYFPLQHISNRFS
jgi:hypothetical protein